MNLAKIFNEYEAKRIPRPVFKERFDLKILDTIVEATRDGLQPKDMEALVKAFTSMEPKKLTAKILIDTLRCLIPVGCPSPVAVRELLLWLVSNLFTLTISTLKTGFTLLIGYVEYDLIDPISIVWAYEKLFVALSRDGLENIICRLLLLVTTPEQITRFRVLRLLNLQQKDRRPYTAAVLGLYKTLRPDKVPEQVQVVSHFFHIKLGENNVMNGLQKSQTRVKVLQNREDAVPAKKRKVNWVLDHPTRSRNANRGCILPPMAFHFHRYNMGNIFEKPRLLVENRTMEEVGKYLLSSHSPSQAMALLASNGGLFYLQFASQDVLQRFHFTLHHTLRQVVVEMQDKTVNIERKMELLQRLLEMQEMHLCGQAVVTRFVSQFLRHHGYHPQLSLLAIKLVERPVFENFQELHSSLLVSIETIFCTADMETKVKILLSVGNLILNLFWKARKVESESAADAEQFTLTNCCKFYERLFNIALASNKPNNCLALIATALHLYKMVYQLESHLIKVKVWTLPPPTLLFACLTSSHCWLVNSACDLLLRHREKAVRIQRVQKALYSHQISLLNDLASNFSHHLYNTTTLQELVGCSRNANLFYKFHPRTLKRIHKLCSESSSMGLDLHLALAPQRSVVKRFYKHHVDFDELNECCKTNYPDVYKFLQILTSRDSDSEDDVEYHRP